MRLFGFNITKAKAEPVNAESMRRMSQTIVSPWEMGKEIYYPENYKILVDSYKSWVYVCASKNSNAVAAAPFRLYVGKKTKDTKILVKTKKIDKNVEMRIREQGNLIPYHRKAVELEEVIEHPFLDMIKSVNPLINRFDLWDGTQLWLELTGNAYWYVYKNSVGVPEELWPLPPQFMQIVGSKEKVIGGYVYSKGVIKVPFDEDEIIHFRFFNPSGSAYGVGPLSAVMDSYIDDRNIRTFESTLMKNMGRPEAVLQSTEPVNDADFRRMKQRWNQNYAGNKKVGQTMILDNGLKYTPITFTPREMNYVVGRKMNREEIAAAFGVPMSKLTTESVNLANARTGEHQYMQDTIEPRLRRIEETINEKLMPMYDKNLFVAYDPVVPSDKEYELREMQTKLDKYVTTVNEERDKLGLDKVKWGDVPLVTPGIGPLGSNPVATVGGDEPEKKPDGEVPPKKVKPGDSSSVVNDVAQDRSNKVPPDKDNKQIETIVDKVIKRTLEKLNSGK